MKRIIIALAVTLCSISKALAQESTLPSPFEFKLIDSTTGTKAELYVRARSWIANAFKDATEVIQMDDKEAGKIIGKGNFLYSIKGGFDNHLCYAPIEFTVTIDIKDGKYRMTLKDFNHKGCFYGKGTSPTGGDLSNAEGQEVGGLFGMTKKQWLRIRQYAQTRAVATLTEFDKAMKTEGAKVDNDGF